MKKLSIFILCLALISLACLETSASAVVVDQPTEMATSIRNISISTAAIEKIAQPLTSASQLCARVIAETAENLRGKADPSARILTHLLNGDVVEVLDQGNQDWWRVKRGDDIGFARSIYLQVVECVK